MYKFWMKELYRNPKLCPTLLSGIMKLMNLRKGSVLFGVLIIVSFLPTISFATKTSCPILSRPLFLGSHGKDVSILQSFLNTEYSDFPTPTGYFGRETERAVRKWQTSHHIISHGTARTTGYGMVGKRTRTTMGLCTSLTPITTIVTQVSVIPTSTTSISTTPPIPTQSLTPPVLLSGGGGTPVPPVPPTPLCTPDTSSPQTQTILCPTGQTGTTTQTRVSSCAVGATSPSWSGWGTTTNTCVVSAPFPPPLACTFTASSISNGSQVTAYQSASVPYGQTCIAQIRSCSNGVLSGTYQYAMCTPLLPHALWQRPVGIQTVELFQDTQFTNGFRAYGTCTKWDSDQGNIENIPPVHLGECIEYEYPLAGYFIHSLPDTGAPNDSGKFWNLNEGAHIGGFSGGGITVPPGSDLQIFRMEANSLTLSNTPNLLWYQNMNNVGITPQDPLYNTRLVRTFTSDRNGSILLYANTKNEIQNNATDNGPTFATNTWPHFYIDQNFKQLIDLGQFSMVNFSAMVKIPRVQTLPGWIGTYQNSAFQIVAVLRRKDNPFVVLFLVYSPFALDTTDYRESIGVDQFGQGMYRGDINDIGGPLVVGGTSRTLTFDFIATLRKAIALRSLLGTVNDYYLSGVEIGWEATGYQEFRSDIANVSLLGTLKQ